MPTENRSSNTEMVSVQATIEALEEAHAGDSSLEFMNDAAQLLRQFKAHTAEQHQGEPVAIVDEGEEGLFIDFIYGENGNPLRRGDMLYTHPVPAVQQEPVAWFTEDHLTDKSATTWDRTVADRWHAKGWPVSPLYPHADPGEVDALRGAYLRAGEREHELRTELAALRQHKTDYMEAAEETRKALLAQLAEQDALLLRALGAIAEVGRQDHLIDYTMVSVVKREIDAALSASAEPSAPKCNHCHDQGEIHTGKMIDQGYWQPPEPDMEPCPHCADEPSAPKCEACHGNGVIGWRRGQTAESYEEGESPCEECKGTGVGAPVERDERAEFEVAPVLGFPSYSVSSDGIVYRNDSGNAIAQQANSKGYLTVNLSESGKATRRTVHRVVLESFVGVRPEGLQALHGDGNPANNRLSNLRWGESSENEADKALHGTKAIGSRNGASRLTEAMVQEILEAKRVGGKKWGAGLLAKKFGVDISTITRAARGKHWSEASAALERKP